MEPEAAGGAARDWTGALLAGGRSRRMGADKLLLRLPSGERLIERPARALRASCGACLLVGSRAGLALPGFLPLADREPGCGPLGGIVAALEWTERRGGHWLLVVAGDMPEVDAALLQELQRAAAPEPRRALWCASSRGVEPLLGAWPVNLLPELQDALAQRRLAVHRALPLEMRRLWSYPTDARMRRAARNLNSPDEWRDYTGSAVRPQLEERA